MPPFRTCQQVLQAILVVVVGRTTAAVLVDGPKLSLVTVKPSRATHWLVAGLAPPLLQQIY